MRKRWAALAAITTAGCLLAVPPAGAHEGNPNYRSEIDSVRPSPPGVGFQVLNYDADMQLVDDGHEVVVYGYEGEPFARVLRDGTVQKNRRSPATYLNVDRYGETAVPEGADPGAPPRWETVGDNGVLRWHDHRMHYMAKAVPSQVKDRGERTKVFDYAIPIRVDGRRGAIAGTLYWAGPADTSKAPFLAAGAAILLAGAAAVLLVRRRRRRDGDGGPSAKAGGEAW